MDNPYLLGMDADGVSGCAPVSLVEGLSEENEKAIVTPNDKIDRKEPLSELVTESSTLRLITLIAFFLRSQFDWTNNVLTQNSNLLGRTLSDVKKKFFLGKKTLRYNLLMRGFNERELEELWNIIYNLFSEMEQLLQFLHKHFKLLEQLLSLFTFYAYFSVFPNAFRHSCTTMPWTIWPSLAILWGVCWMFYGTPPGYEAETLAQFRDARFPPEIDEDTDWDSLLESAESIENADFFLDFNAGSNAWANHDEFLHNNSMAIPAMSMFANSSDGGTSQAVFPPEVLGPVVVSRRLILEQGRAITSRPGSSMGLVESNLLAPRSAASPTSQVNQRTSDVRPIMSRDAFQLRPPSAAILTNEGQTVEQEGTSEQVKTREAKRRKGATHGKVIKYFCDESGCPRQSEGFKRRDHLKQHLSGVHKRTLGRLRTQDSTTMSTLSPTEATSSSTSSQSQPPQPPPSAVALGKRKRESAMHEQETQDSEIAWQLTSGRRLQMLMHEVKELREQVERYRGKYLDLLGGGST